MSIFCTLLRRELASFFLTWAGYIIIAAVALLTGLSFVVVIQNLGGDPSPMPLLAARLKAIDGCSARRARQARQARVAVCRRVERGLARAAFATAPRAGHRFDRT